MHIREAIPGDNEGLLKLTSLISMKGAINLRIDRNPDFFGLLRERGAYYILVAENDAQIVGIIASAMHKAIIMGNLRVVYYISDFKVHPNHQNSSLAFKLVSALHNYLKSIDADLLLCTSILGNKKVEPFFRGSLGLPAFTEMGTFSVLQILPPLWMTRPYQINSMATQHDMEELSDFYNRTSQPYAMAPFTQPEDLMNMANLIERENGKIVAAICIADYMHLKQNVVTKLPARLNLVSRSINLLARLVPSFHLPQEGEAIRLLNVKRMASSSGKMFELKKLISAARYMLYKNHFIFLTVAIHPADPHRKIFTNLPKFTFYSKVWLSSLKGDQNLLRSLQSSALFEDYSLV